MAAILPSILAAIRRLNKGHSGIVYKKMVSKERSGPNSITSPVMSITNQDQDHQFFDQPCCTTPEFGSPSTQDLQRPDSGLLLDNILQPETSLQQFIGEEARDPAHQVQAGRKATLVLSNSLNRALEASPHSSSQLGSFFDHDDDDEDSYASRISKWVRKGPSRTHGVF